MIKKKRYIIANITYCLCKKLLIASLHYLIWASLVTQTVKNLPAVQETWDQSLGREDFLEKGMATHSSILTWRIPRTEEPGGLQSMGSQSIEYNRGTFTHILISSPWWNLLLSDVVLFIYVLMCSHPPPVLE